MAHGHDNKQSGESESVFTLSHTGGGCNDCRGQPRYLRRPRMEMGARRTIEQAVRLHDDTI